MVVWRALAAEVTAVLGGPGPESPSVCGVGCGGPMTPSGEEVSPLNIPAWQGFPLRSRLAELTGLPTHVDNDAKALALAEGWRGAAAGVPDYLAMVVSTGVGGGIVLDGRLLDGRLGNAGHIGHVIVEPDGRPCACGGRGCLEAEASGTAIAEVTGRPAAEAPPEVVGPHRHPGRKGGGVGGQSARPRPGSGGRLGGPGVRRALLRRRPPRGVGSGPHVVLRRRSGDPGGPWRRRPAHRGAAAVGWRALGAPRVPGAGSGVVGAVAVRPWLWVAALVAVFRLARPGWWRHRPSAGAARGLLALSDGHRLRGGR